MRITNDSRGYSYWDVFPLLQGQLNISVTQPKQRRGFHLHKEKFDHWAVLEGPILLVTKKEKGDFEEKIYQTGDEFTINPNIWHACQALDTPAIIAYYETLKSGAERYDDFEMDLDTYKGWR